MFNLNKLIKMVKKGELLKKPFNIKKKAEDDEGYGDWGGAYNPDENLDLKGELGQAETGQTQNLDIEGTPIPAADQNIELVDKPISPSMMKIVTDIMDDYIMNNRELLSDILAQEEGALERGLKAPINSLVPTVTPELAQAMGVYKGFIGVFKDKIHLDVPEEPDTTPAPKQKQKVDMLVNTILSKTNSSLFMGSETEEKGPVLYDDTTKGVLTRFLPENLSKVKGKDGRSEYDRVLDALYGKGDEVGKGTGAMYNEMAFTESVNQMFGVPKGNDLDQRMMFFLANSKLLLEPYFPKEAPTNTIFQQVPDLEKDLQDALKTFGIVDPMVTDGLFKVQGKTAANVGGRSSPKSVMAKLLKHLAEPELLEILQQLTERLDPSIVQWFKSQLAYAGKKVGKEKVSIDALETNRGTPGGKPIPDIAPTTTEEEENATLQTGAIIENYLSRQIESMAIMSDSVVSSLMNSNSDKYTELKAMLNQPLSISEKTEVIKQISTALKKYTTTEFLNGFSTYAIDGIKEIFKKEGLGNRKKYVDSGGVKKNTNIAYNTDFGRANIPESVIREIFKSDRRGKKETPYDYVRKYMQEINDGKRLNPWTLDWREAVNYRIPYNMFADMFMLKSQIKEAYNRAEGSNLRKKEYGGDINKEDLIEVVYNNIDGYPQSRKMLEDFSGISYEDQEGVKKKKKKKFIQITLDQTEANLKSHKSSFDARKKYSEKRAMYEALIENKFITEEERNGHIADLRELNLEERDGIETNKPQTKMVNGKKVPVIRLDGHRQMIRAGSILKNIKGKIGENIEPLLPGILDAMQSSQTKDVMERLAENNFLQLFNHRSDKYESYGAQGKKKNSYDEEERTNTELYHAILNNGIVPTTAKKISDFLDISQGSDKDKEYLGNLRKLFKSKKGIRENTKLLREKKEERTTYILYYLNPMAFERVLKMKSDPELFENIFKAIPSNEQQEFREEVFENWNGEKELPNRYYDWLQKLGKPLSNKIDIEVGINKLEKNNIKIMNKMKKIEEVNASLEPQTSLNRAYASGSCLRMVYAEYNTVLSKIDKLCKIQKFSYKFASVDTVSIDDTILGIEKDFENLLDSLVR